jgi:uncharacterized membrane protein
MPEPLSELHIGRVAQTRLEHEPTPGGHPMELWVSAVLRGGVLVAGAIIALGLGLLLLRGTDASQPGSLHDLRARGGQPLPIGPQSLVHGVLAGHPSAIIQVGVLALILTPVWRVAMTVGLFAMQRDAIFICITVVVLTILVLGVVGVGS